MERQTSPLATKPIEQLIGQYSVPIALTLMVNYLYNIVDQIFVGQGVGITAMAATNVAFPLTIIFIAIGLLIGDGCAANMSLSLGANDQDLADRTIGQAVAMLLVCGVAIAVLCQLLAPQLVHWLGATDTAYASSLLYTRTIILGLPFLMTNSALSVMLRADGCPQYPMKCMMAGAAVNLVLDPIFIFPLQMGVVGAGIATVLGQIVAGVACIAYLPRLKSVTLKRKNMWLTAQLALRICQLGLPSLCTQLLTAMVQIVMNNLMRAYGDASVFGADMALSVYGMVLKVYQIAHAMFIGISGATQPINGYNFGAKNYDCVHQTYRYAVKLSLAVSVVWFGIYQFLGQYIAMIFLANNALYQQCASHFFRLYMLAFFIYGAHLVTISFFQAIGKAGKALLIPLCRQGLLTIPLSIFLASRYGIDGALLATPVADILTLILVVVLAKGEFSLWQKEEELSI